MNQSYIPFKKWYSKFNDCSISIDLQNNVILIVDEDGNTLQSAHFSRNVPAHFKIDELFDSAERGTDSYSFYIIENGYGGKNWLYTLKLTSLE